ncbi:hypothetical protein Tco_1057667 [Tanacetum coccineum]|uniref:Uncharacterized protein n=1 Tax=Tanacetum coccineum TaxID=301880 RepID=A0ABQ5H7N7_9ASTR
MLQRFNMPTQTIPMLSKKPKKATNDLHKDILGTRNPGLGYMAKRAQPVLSMIENPFCITNTSPCIIKERTTQRPDYVSEWCFDYAKQFVEQQLKKISALLMLSSSFPILLCPPSSNCLCEDLRSACDREHTKVLELEAEISKQKQLISESEKRFAFLEQNYVSLQLKFQNFNKHETL